VGEKEAELFVPGQSGVILNQKQIAAAAPGIGAVEARVASEDIARIADAVITRSHSEAVGAVRTSQKWGPPR